MEQWQRELERLRQEIATLRRQVLGPSWTAGRQETGQANRLALWTSETQLGAAPVALQGGALVPVGTVALGSTTARWSTLSGGSLDLTGNALIGGRVGIGLAAPAYPLDVAGDVRWSGTLQGGTVPPARISPQGPGSGLDADLVDGQHLSDLDARFVNVTGDTISGNLTITGGLSARPYVFDVWPDANNLTIRPPGAGYLNITSPINIELFTNAYKAGDGNWYRFDTTKGGFAVRLLADYRLVLLTFGAGTGAIIPTGILTLFPSGGVYIGSSPSDPGAGNLRVEKRLIVGTRGNIYEVSASGTGDLTIPLGRFGIGTGILITAHIEGAYAERGATVFIGGDWNSLQNVALQVAGGSGDVLDRLKFYGYVDPSNAGAMFLFATWRNDSPNKAYVNTVRLIVQTAGWVEPQNTGSFASATLLPVGGYVVSGQIIATQTLRVGSGLPNPGANNAFVAGNVGIGTTSLSYRLNLPNVANASGRGIANAWVTYSSERLKENLEPVREALALVQRLTGKRFRWKGSAAPDIGLIAEETVAVLPEAVTPDEEGRPLGLNIVPVVAVLVEAVKELDARLQALEQIMRAA